MSKKINIGIIGAGAFAQQNHIPCLLSNQTVNLDWFFDTNKNTQTIVKSMYGLKKVADSKLNTFLDKTDIVLLTVPVGVREPYYKVLSDKGITTYVEKPFARTINEFEEISNQYSKSSVIVGFNRLNYKNHQIIKMLIKNSTFGNLSRVHIRQGFFGLSGWSGFRGNSKQSGGGILIESGIHLINTLISVLEADSVDILKKYILIKNGIDYHTEASGIIYFGDNNSELKIEISSIQNFESGIWFEFKNTVVHYPISPGEEVTVKGIDNHTVGVIKLDLEGAVTFEESLKMQWEKCISSFLNGYIGVINAKTERLTVEVIDQLYREDLT